MKSKAENQLQFKQYSKPSDLLITKSWHCYGNGSVNILCEMLISWGNVWLMNRR